MNADRFFKNLSALLVWALLHLGGTGVVEIVQAVQTPNLFGHNIRVVRVIEHGSVHLFLIRHEGYLSFSVRSGQIVLIIPQTAPPVKENFMQKTENKFPKKLDFFGEIWYNTSRVCCEAPRISRVVRCVALHEHPGLKEANYHGFD